MADIALTGSADSGGLSNAPSITHGLTINEGDVVVAIVHVDNAPTITDNNGSTPLTKDYGESWRPDTDSYAIFSRVAGASEPSAYAFSLTSSDSWTVLIRVFSGVHADIWDVAPSISTRNYATTGTALTAPAMTVVAGAMGIVIATTDSNSRTFSSVSNGYGSEQQRTANRAQANWLKLWTSAGSTGTTTATMSSSNDWLFHQISLKPAPANTQVDPGLGVVSFIGFALSVAITANVVVSPDVGAVDLTGFAPTVVAANDITIPLDVGGLDFNGFEPTVAVSDNQNIALDVGSLDLTGFNLTAAVTDNINIDLDVGAVDLTGYALTAVATSDIDISLDVGSLTFIGFAPVVTANANKNVNIDVGSLAITGYELTVEASNDIVIPLDVGSLSLTGYELTVATPKTVALDVGSLTFIGFAPTVVATANRNIALDVGSLNLTGYELTVVESNDVNIALDVGSLTFVGFEPSVIPPIVGEATVVISEIEHSVLITEVEHSVVITEIVVSVEIFEEESEGYSDDLGSLLIDEERNGTFETGYGQTDWVYDDDGGHAESIARTATFGWAFISADDVRITTATLLKAFLNPYTDYPMNVMVDMDFWMNARHALDSLSLRLLYDDGVSYSEYETTVVSPITDLFSWKNYAFEFPYTIKTDDGIAVLQEIVLIATRPPAPSGRGNYWLDDISINVRNALSDVAVAITEQELSVVITE